MGVSGSGKTTVARALSVPLGWTMLEGDDFHSAENRARMKAGIALTDADRASWLDALARELQRHPDGVVLSCSALKLAYRELLRAARPGSCFVFLNITPALAHQRVQSRAGHFFNPELVSSQFAALEAPVNEPDVLWLDASRPILELCEAALTWLRQQSAPGRFGA
jgi:gluconokinase